MAYTPRGRKKLNYKVAIPLLVLAVFVVFFSANLVMKNQGDKEAFVVCDLNSEKTIELLDKKYKQTYEFKDYLVYGESLSLFAKNYTGLDADDMNGKTIKLKDVCSDRTYSFVVDRKVDRKILLGHIEAGFYEVYLVEDLKEKRLYSSEEIFHTTHTVTRDETNKRVELISTNEILSGYDIKMNQNYTYLQVSEEAVAKNVYDVVIDPAGNDTSFSYGMLSNTEGNGLNEAEESYKAALLLKAELDKLGFKTLILRDEDEIKNTYGKDGRLAKAYEVEAKYYFRLGFSQDENSSIGGYTIVHSNHSTNILAAQIAYDFSKKLKMEGNSIYANAGDRPGVIAATLATSDIDNRNVYDSDLWIREVGGKATQAGMFSEATKEGTELFAKDKLNGIYGLNISFGYLTNSADANNWKSNKENIIKELADSIAIYLDIEE